MRADQRLVELGLVPSRARAQAEIRAGTVRRNGAPLLRASETTSPEDVLEIAAPENPYVSRGGLKLAAALDHFGMDVQGQIALDLGASTGGFADVLLRRGAGRVFAVDIGHGQMAEALRADPRVVLFEGMDARRLTPALITAAPDLVTADLSFISLKIALPVPLGLAAHGAKLLALIKPQFEAGRGATKRGIVKDKSVHEQTCEAIAHWIEAEMGWLVLGLMASPILGGEGNAEFFIAATRA